MKRSISQIIANKILDHLEHQSIGDIFLRSLLLLIATFFTLAILYPATTKSISGAIFAWNNFAIFKTAIIFATVFNIKKIGGMALEIFNERSNPKKIPTGDTIEGIPTLELLDHLFEHKSFKREDIENKFKIPRNRYGILATKLESIGVLKRGENNSRVLNEEYARADIASILENVSSAKDLKAVFRQTSANSYTRDPSAATILDRVTSAITPLSPPRFERKRIDNREMA